MTEHQKHLAAAIRQLRAEGMSYVQISKTFGYSTTYVRGCEEAADQFDEWMKRTKSHWLADSKLGIRVFYVLNNLTITSREQLIEAVLTGRLKPKGRGCRNYGHKSHAAVLKWLNISAEQLPVRMERCPHCSKLVPITLFIKP